MRIVKQFTMVVLFATMLALPAFTQTPKSVTAPVSGADQIQVPIPKTPAEVPGPVPGNIMTKEYVQLRRRYGLRVGIHDGEHARRRAAFPEAPEPGLLDRVVPITRVSYNQMLTTPQPDQTFIVCPNQDVAYRADSRSSTRSHSGSGAGLGDRSTSTRCYDRATDRSPDRQAGRHEAHFCIVAGPNWRGDGSQRHH